MESYEHFYEYIDQNGLLRDLMIHVIFSQEVRAKIDVWGMDRSIDAILHDKCYTLLSDIKNALEEMPNDDFQCVEQIIETFEVYSIKVDRPNHDFG